MGSQLVRRPKGGRCAAADGLRTHPTFVDDETSGRYAAIYETLRTAGTPIPTNDVWIAASAMQHGLRLLTLDSHFRRVAQVLVNLFDR